MLGQQGDDFHQLLEQLSHIFERLQQQNLTLARESQGSRSKVSGGLVPPIPCLTPRFRDKAPNDEVLQHFCLLDQNNTGRLSINDLARILHEAGEEFDYDILAEALKVLAEPLCEAEMESNSKAPSINCEAFARLMDMSFQSCRPEVEHCLVSLRRVTSRACSARPSVRSAEDAKMSPPKPSRGMTSSLSITASLMRQFRTLDEHDKGRLYLEDLVRIMRRFNERVEYDSLIGAVQVLNGCKPDDPVNVQTEDLSIDFTAFIQLMDEDWTVDDGCEDLCDCISSMRRACELGSQLSPPGLTTPEEKEWECSSICEARFWVEVMPTFVIMLNLVITGFSTDWPEYSFVWDICEYVFALFYLFEFVMKIRLLGIQGYFMGLERLWNCFDFLCLCLSIAEIFVHASLFLFVEPTAVHEEAGGLRSELVLIRIFRLCRLARVIRTLRFKMLHELKQMVFGVLSGLRVLSWAIALLFMLIYVVAVIVTNLLGDNVSEFGSMVQSMSTLFRCWTDGCSDYDGRPLPEKVRKEYGIVFVIMYMMTTTIVTVGVFNLIMAIFIENVVTSHAVQKQKELGNKARDFEMRLKDSISSFLNIKKARSYVRSGPARWQAVSAEWERLRSHNLEISRERFNSWLQDQDFQSLLQEAEIDIANKFQLFDVLDVDQGGLLSLDELTTGLMNMRGPITKADIVAVRLMVRHLIMDLEERSARESVRTKSRSSKAMPVSSCRSFSMKSSR